MFVTDDGTILAAALFRRRSTRDSAGTVALASVGWAARSSIFMENRRPGACAARVYLNREMRPLWSANSGRSVSQPPTGGTRAPRREAPCAHALSYALRLCLSLSLSSSISAPVHPRPPISFSRSSLYAPVIQHDGGCVYPALPLLPFLFVFVTLARSLSLPCLPSSLSALHFLPRTENLLCSADESYPIVAAFHSLVCYVRPSLDSIMEGSRVANRCHAASFCVNKGTRTLDNI